jgi:excisionase family DNA binding protein
MGTKRQGSLEYGKLDRQLLTLEEVQDALHMGQTSVKRMIATGQLVSLKIGKSRRVPAEAVRKYVRDLLKSQGVEL